MSIKVSVVLPLLITQPFLLYLSEFCIKSLRNQADQEYELVVVEKGTRHFDPDNLVDDPMLRVDKYLHIPSDSSNTNYTKEFNAGCDLAEGEFIVHIGNDVIVTPGWVGALLEPFERYPDCGLSSCSASEPGAFIGPRVPVPLIVEGFYGPMMMFSKEWRLDDAYPGGYSDCDLVMRIYSAGHRAYRNCRLIIHHLSRTTWMRSYVDKGVSQMEIGEKLFYERWNKCPLMIFSVMTAGGVAYGREHESLLVQRQPYHQRILNGGL